jgi:hypothetical protein
MASQCDWMWRLQAALSLSRAGDAVAARGIRIQKRKDLAELSAIYRIFTKATLSRRVGYGFGER